jgi:hypothetical protein
MKICSYSFKKSSIHPFKIHPWNQDDFNAKNSWNWQLGNASMPM